MRRRDFLERSLVAGAGLLAPAAALSCDDPADPDAGTRPDAFTPDTGPPPPFRGLSKGPYVQLLSPGRARLRFESRVDEPFGVVIERASGRVEPTPARSAMELSYERDALGMERYLPDEPGLHVVHEVVLEDLAPGEDVGWTVTPPEGEAAEGGFKASVAPGTPFTLGWVSDTSFPMAEDGIGVLAAQAPDVVLHGGDITYQANPFDTWNGMFRGMRPLMSRAATQLCVGNHEFENLDEISVQFDRLFAGQGDEGSMPRYFAFTYGAVRFLCIDTESGRLQEMEDTQIAWIDAELEAASADPDILFPILAFHRPTYTLSKHAPGDTAVRDLLHARIVDHGVPLVLAGHAHAYERFVVDGVHYVIDGGGGAILYDPNEDRDAVEAMRPGEPDLRAAVNESHGVTVVDVAADGALSLRRLAAADGSVQDEATIPAS